jgi:hypothetical protein
MKTITKLKELLDKLIVFLAYVICWCYLIFGGEFHLKINFESLGELIKTFKKML